MSKKLALAICSVTDYSSYELYVNEKKICMKLLLEN